MDKNLNTKKKLIIYIISFAIIMILSLLSYNLLKQNFQGQNLLTFQEKTVETNEANIDKEVEMDKDNNDKKIETETPKAPDFYVFTENNEKVFLTDFIGKPTVINFWATWCPNCVIEMPYFQEVYEEMGDTINFMMIDLVDGNRETFEDGKNFIKKHKFTFPVYYDLEQSAGYAFGIRVLPTTFFVDKNGYIQGVAQGQIDKTTLLKGIDLIK